MESNGDTDKNSTNPGTQEGFFSAAPKIKDVSGNPEDPSAIEEAPNDDEPIEAKEDPKPEVEELK